MPILSSPGVLRRLLLPVLLLSAAPVALAQAPTFTFAPPATPDSDPAELLARALRTLQAEPRNLDALMAAGHNALLLGDSNAAVGFFGRAQEIAPRDGRVKAGLGSALVQLEKPQDALRLFADASRLGVPDVDLAADRGLAYDLTGDPKRAQRDYALVLAAHSDDDTTRRRLALSQGISGDKAAAIQTLDPLIRKKDIAAWRAQTFVLAMNGDTKGANDITRVMLPQQATMLQPFLARLAGLTPAAKARAVHFGEMPAAGQRYSPNELANIGTRPTYAAAPRSDLAPAPQGTQFTQTPTASPPPPPVFEPAMPSPAAAGHYDIPHVAGERAARTIGTPVVHGRTGDDEGTRSTRSKASAGKSSHADEDEDCKTVKVTSKGTRHHKGKTTTKQVCKAHKGKGGEDQGKGHSKASGADEGEDCTRVKTTTGGSKHHKGHATTKLVCKKSKGVDSSTSVKGKHGKSTADDADGETAKVQKASTHGKAADEDCKTVKVTSKGTRHHKGKTTTKQVCKSTDDDTTPAKARKGTSTADADDDSSAKGHKASAHGKSVKVADEGDDDSSSKATETGKGAQVYVQVAGGANKADMDKAWSRVKKKAPELMKGKTPATTPLHATHRLVVGPFKDEDEAQAFVNKMAGKGISGFVVKTNKGQKVEKIDAAP